MVILPYQFLLRYYWVGSVITNYSCSKDLTFKKDSVIAKTFKSMMI